jgi:hypothetical protein
MLLIVLLASAALAGALSGALTACWLIRRKKRPQVQPQPAPATDPVLSAEIDRAAAAWADAHGRPEAKGLVVDKMHLIHRIAQRRGWWS